MTCEAHGDEVSRIVCTALTAVLDVMKLKTVLAGRAAELALVVVPVENRLSNALRDVLGMLAGPVARQLIRHRERRVAAFFA